MKKKKNTKNKSKIVKMNTSFESKNLIHSRKLKFTLLGTIIILILLIVRIGFLQFIDGNHLRELAYNQQTINQIISLIQ